MANDFLGNEIKIGSLVVFVQLGYRNLMLGEIVKITKCTVQISHEETNVGSVQTKQDHAQVIVVD